jgi:hypothetical protein
VESKVVAAPLGEAFCTEGLVIPRRLEGASLKLAGLLFRSESSGILIKVMIPTNPTVPRAHFWGKLRRLSDLIKVFEFIFSFSSQH